MKHLVCKTLVFFLNPTKKLKQIKVNVYCEVEQNLNVIKFKTKTGNASKRPQHDQSAAENSQMSL